MALINFNGAKITHALPGGTGKIELNLNDSIPANFPTHWLIKENNMVIIDEPNEKEPNILITGVPIGDFMFQFLTADQVPGGGAASVGVLVDGVPYFDTHVVPYPTQ